MPLGSFLGLAMLLLPLSHERWFSRSGTVFCRQRSSPSTAPYHPLSGDLQIDVFVSAFIEQETDELTNIRASAFGASSDENLRYKAGSISPTGRRNLP